MVEPEVEFHPFTNLQRIITSANKQAINAMEVIQAVFQSPEKGNHSGAFQQRQMQG